MINHYFIAEIIPYNNILYITTNQPLQQDDWYIECKRNKPEAIDRPKQYINGEIKEAFKKIVASSDPALNVFLLSNNFIKQFRLAPSENALLKYEEYMTNGWNPTYNNPDNFNMESPAELDYKLMSVDHILFVEIPKSNINYTDFTISEHGNLFGINPITKEKSQCDLYLNLRHCNIISKLSDIHHQPIINSEMIGKERNILVMSVNCPI